MPTTGPGEVGEGAWGTKRHRGGRWGWRGAPTLEVRDLALPPTRVACPLATGTVVVGRYHQRAWSRPLWFKTKARAGELSMQPIALSKCRGSPTGNTRSKYNPPLPGHRGASSSSLLLLSLSGDPHLEITLGCVQSSPLTRPPSTTCRRQTQPLAAGSERRCRAPAVDTLPLPVASSRHEGACGRRAGGRRVSVAVATDSGGADRSLGLPAPPGQPSSASEKGPALAPP